MQNKKSSTDLKSSRKMAKSTKTYNYIADKALTKREGSGCKGHCLPARTRNLLRSLHGKAGPRSVFIFYDAIISPKWALTVLRREVCEWKILCFIYVLFCPTYGVWTAVLTRASSIHPPPAFRQQKTGSKEAARLIERSSAGVV